MAAKNPPELSATELELKRRGRRRLIGAITLGLLAIVFLPMVFDNEPRKSGSTSKPQEISVQIPSKEGQPAVAAPSVAPVIVAPSESKQAVAPAPVTPTAAPPATAVATEPTKTSSPPAKEVTTATKTSPPAKVAAVSPEKPAKPAKADVEPKSPVVDKKGFVVQLGVFTDAENAKHVIDKMKEVKLAVYTETIPVKAGNATRVRVGPYATREKADAALAQVKLAGADGKIVPLK